MIIEINDSKFKINNMAGKEKEKEKEKEGRVDYSQWLQRGPNTFIPTDNAKTVARIEPGVYNLRFSNPHGFYLFKKTLQLDELLILPSKAESEVLGSITKFWSRKDKFKEYGFIYKRGILLYGPPGTGKTCLINIISERMIKEHDGVVFVIQGGSDLELYTSFIPEIFRTIEPNRPILTIIEDIDCFCTGGSNETELINMLDGIEQIDNVIYLATTNYTEKLPGRLLNRPNRFDRRIKVGYPTAEVREAYFIKKLKPHDLEAIEKSPIPLKTWVAETKNMTLSHLGELIKSVIILDNDFYESIKLLKELKEIPFSGSYNKGDDEGSNIGFKKEILHRHINDSTGVSSFNEAVEVARKQDEEIKKIKRTKKNDKIKIGI